MIKLIKPHTKNLSMFEFYELHFHEIQEEVSFMYGEEIITEKITDIFLPIIVESSETVLVKNIHGMLFTFIHPENIEFWGQGGKQGFLSKLKENRTKEIKLHNNESLFFDDEGEAISPIKQFSKSKLELEKKTLMAHIMFELGIFKSVNEAKKNGWNKPIELGDFCVTKRKISFEIIE